MSLTENLRAALFAKRRIIDLLASGEMVTHLYGIDVSVARLAQEREEADLLEAALDAFDQPGFEDVPIEE